MAEPILQVVSESREAEDDRSPWKVVVWAALSIGLGYLFIASFERWSVSFENVYLWSLIVTAVLFWSLVTLQVLFIKGLGKLALIAFLECAAPLLIFWSRLYPAPSLVLVIGAAATFILSFFALLRGRSFALNSVKLRFFDISKVFLPRFVTAWLILLAVLFYLNYFVWGYFSPALRTAVLDGTVTAAAPIVKIWVPGFSLNVSVDDFLKNVAKSQLQAVKYNPLGTADQNLTVFFSQLSPQQQTELLDAATTQIEQKFTAQFGTFDPNESMLKFSDGLVAYYFAKFVQSVGAFAPFIIAAVVFFLLKGIVALFYWLISFIAFIIFKIAIIFGFARTSIESRSREFVLL